MELYTVRNGFRMVKALRTYEGIKLQAMLAALFSKNQRMKMLDSYHDLGIREAGKYFIVHPDSEKYPFLETFIFNMYKFCDYRGKTVIDVGAQTGDSVLYFSHEGAKIIYAFEPLKSNFKILQKNVVQNKINCIYYNTGMGNETSSIEAAVDGNMITASEITAGSDHENMKIDRLDNFKIDADIIKIDVEGFEMEVLEGGISTVKSANTVIIETHSKGLQMQVAKFLSNAGFKLTRIIGTSRDVRVEYWVK